MILRAVASAALSSPADRSAVDSMYSTRVSFGLAFNSSLSTSRAFAAPPSMLINTAAVTDLQVAARLARAANRFFVGRGRILHLTLALVKLAELREIARVDLGGLHERLLGFIQLALRDLRFVQQQQRLRRPRRLRRDLFRESVPQIDSAARSCSRPSVICRFGLVAISGVFWMALRCSIAASRVETGDCPAAGGVLPSAHDEYTVPRMLWASTLSLSIFNACSAAATASVGRFWRK
jgi:hypothetical protein